MRRDARVGDDVTRRCRAVPERVVEQHVENLARGAARRPHEHVLVGHHLELARERGEGAAASAPRDRATTLPSVDGGRRARAGLARACASRSAIVASSRSASASAASSSARAGLGRRPRRPPRGADARRSAGCAAGARRWPRTRARAPRARRSARRWRRAPGRSRRSPGPRMARRAPRSRRRPAARSGARSPRAAARDGVPAAQPARSPRGRRPG